MTQGLWKAVMGTNPSFFKGDDNYPVEHVSWNDAQEFIEKLNRLIPGSSFRLPTAAEWEYVCRAGSPSDFYFGDDESLLGDYAWYNKNSGERSHSVAGKKPNDWGLYDMHGNVWEWCQDKDVVGSYRVIRGGGWNFLAWGCRSTFRYRFPLDIGFYSLGFRLARTL